MARTRVRSVSCDRLGGAWCAVTSRRLSQGLSPSCCHARRRETLWGNVGKIARPALISAHEVCLSSRIALVSHALCRVCPQRVNDLARRGLSATHGAIRWPPGGILVSTALRRSDCLPPLPDPRRTPGRAGDPSPGGSPPRSAMILRARRVSPASRRRLMGRWPPWSAFTCRPTNGWYGPR